jgi:hypothetical protein
MKTIRTGKVGKRELRLVEKSGRFFGVINGTGRREPLIEGDVADDVWRRLHDAARKADPAYFGYDGARNRFLRFFHGGFRSADFVREEREYKIAAKSKLDLTVPLVDAATGSGFGEAVLSVFNATNLLSPFEKMHLKDVLRGPAADAFVRAAARFATGERTALGDLEHLLRPFDSAKWTVVTYLPFLWRPEAHMFLKPEVTKDFAARVGHRFATDYEAHLDPQVYDCLLDLTAQTLRELADLEPRDGIDVQSFIWVVGAYEEQAEPPVP